jgi:hypothetical protein
MRRNWGRSLKVYRRRNYVFRQSRLGPYPSATPRYATLRAPGSLGPREEKAYVLEDLPGTRIETSSYWMSCGHLIRRRSISVFLQRRAPVPEPVSPWAGIRFGVKSSSLAGHDRDELLQRPLGVLNKRRGMDAARHGTQLSVCCAALPPYHDSNHDRRQMSTLLRRAQLLRPRRCPCPWAPVQIIGACGYRIRHGAVWDSERARCLSTEENCPLTGRRRASCCSGKCLVR